MSAADPASLRRADDTAALVRELNARIRALAATMPEDDAAYTFVCECGCWREVGLPLATFDATGHAWASGHAP